jgi:hypothetical protein
VIVGMVANEVPAGADDAGDVRKGLRPASLDEERCSDVQPLELLGQSQGGARFGRPVGMLYIEGQRNWVGSTIRRWRTLAMTVPAACVDAAVYLSTPVMTIPRVNTRWKSRKMTIGMIIVISVPAWMSPGFTAMRAPLKKARPTGRVRSSGLPER